MVQEFASLALGLLIAWGIIAFVPVRKHVSTFALQPWPLELDDSNLMLIGVGLASQKPSKPSVMDASSTPAQTTVAIMTPKPSPMPVPGPVPVISSPMPMAPTPVSMSPTPLTTVPSPSS
jgi:hypothetical protein